MAQTKDKKNWPCGPLSRNHSPVGTARERCKVLKRSGFSSCSCNDTLIMYFKSNYSHMTHILIAIVWLCFLPFLVLQWFKFINISLLVSHNAFAAFLIEYQAPSVTMGTFCNIFGSPGLTSVTSIAVPSSIVSAKNDQVSSEPLLKNGVTDATPSDLYHSQSEFHFQLSKFWVSHFVYLCYCRIFMITLIPRPNPS